MDNVEALVEAHPYHGFPLVDGGLLKGYITRARLREAIGSQNLLCQNFFLTLILLSTIA